MRAFYRSAACGFSLALLPGRGECEEAAALYRAYWAGMPVGEISLDLRYDAARYHNEITISTEGIARLATRFRGSAASDGSLAAASLPSPSRYAAAYDLHKRRDRHLSMRFAVRNGAVIADRGADDTSRKPALAERFRTNVLDPLSALTAIRRELRGGASGTFSIPVYDGARRFDVGVRVLPKQGGDRDLHLALTLTPIAGFKGETSEDGDPDDAPRPVAVTMSDDQRLMPLSMTASLYFLPLVVELTRWCDTMPCPR
jgi:hypothetical protein